MGHDGKLIPYGLDGQSAKNYRKYGVYARDDDPEIIALNSPTLLGALRRLRHRL